MSDNRRRDGSKLSFSERDKQRRDRQNGPDRGSGPSNGPANSARSAQADRSYRAALEKAFATGKVQELAASLNRHSTISLDLPSLRPPVAAPPANGAAPAEPSDGSPPPPPRKPAVDPVVVERRELTDKIREAENARDVAKAIDKYLARFGALPRDWDILEKALGHAKPSVVTTALTEIEAWLAREKPRRNRSLAMQLAIIVDHHDDAEVREHAARVRAAL